MLKSKLFKFKNRHHTTEINNVISGEGGTVISHWLACPLAQGTQQQSEHYQSTKQPIYMLLLITFLPDQEMLPKMSRVYWNNTGKERGESRVDRNDAWNGPAFIPQCHYGLCTILPCVKDACMSTRGDLSRAWFYTKPSKFDLISVSEFGIRHLIIDLAHALPASDIRKIV